MSLISNLPAQAVLPLKAYDLEALLKDAVRADQTVLRADFDGVADKAGVMDRLASGFALPEHFGRNLDALADCLSELEPEEADRPGFVVILRHLPDGAGFSRDQREALLDVFRDTADVFFDRGVAFRVFYSVGAKAA
jgi:RNAse (barnase) inhibitor barstar